MYVTDAGGTNSVDGAGGVFVFGGVGEWCRVGWGCCGARLWAFLNAVVCQYVSLSVWCGVCLLPTVEN